MALWKKTKKKETTAKKVVKQTTTTVAKEAPVKAEKKPATVGSHKVLTAEGFKRRLLRKS